MIYLILTMAFFVIGTSTLWAYANYARRDMDRLSALETWSGRYFDCATKFVETENAPYQLLTDIQELNRSLDDTKMPSKLVTILENVPVKRFKANHLGEVYSFLHRENLLPLYREMAKAYIFLISYKDRARGNKIRDLFNEVKLYNAEQRSKVTAPPNSEDSRAFDIVDELLSAKHNGNCIMAG